MLSLLARLTVPTFLRADARAALLSIFAQIASPLAMCGAPLPCVADSFMTRLNKNHHRRLICEAPASYWTLPKCLRVRELFEMQAVPARQNNALWQAGLGVNLKYIGKCCIQMSRSRFSKDGQRDIPAQRINTKALVSTEWTVQVSHLCKWSPTADVLITLH